MKKTGEIINLPIIDISEGVEIGTATKMIVNPIGGSIAALVVDDGKWYLGAKLLPFAAIAGLGESAITIISQNEILTIENAPALEQLLATDIAVIGAKILTKAGRIQGVVTDFTIDLSGKIIECEIEKTDGEMDTISAEQIMTFGKKVIIIADETGSTTGVSTAKVESVVLPVTPAVAAPTAEVVTEAKTVTPAPVKEVVKEAAKETPNDDSARKFDEKQRRYLLGKQASRRIETDNGVLIVEQGGEINEEVLQKAKLAGKFVELSMNIQ